MNQRRLAPLIALIIILGGVVAVLAVPFTDPTFPFYGSAGTGPIYFENSFDATAGYYTGGCVVFSDFNMASAGVFGTIGFAAELGVSVNVISVIPSTSITLEVTSGGAGGNFTVYTPSAIVYNATGVTAWGYDSGFTEAQVPAGVAVTIVLSLQAGGITPLFLIPEWFINQGGVVFGVAGFFTSLMSVMTAFVAWFASAIANVVSIIYYVMTMVMFLAGSVIYWFGAFVSFFIQLFTIMGTIMDGTSSVSTGFGNMWNLIGLSTWIGAVPVFGFLWYYDALGPRIKKSGRNFFEVITGDVQIVMYWVGLMWEWSWTVFNFVYGIVMQFVGLLWGLIP